MYMQSGDGGNRLEKIGSDVLRSWDYKHREQPEKLIGIDYKRLSDGTVFFFPINQEISFNKR